MRDTPQLSDPENNEQNMDTEENPEIIEGSEETGEGDTQELTEDEIEYLTLDKQLDDLDRALDVLEQKNDSIHAQLKALLETNRDIQRTSDTNNQKQE